jgi:CBS domain-containing protein
MLLCPACGAENIEGSDECVECQASLTELSIPQAVTALEKGLLKDRIEVLKPRPPLMVRAETPIGEVLRQMVEQRLGCAVIVDDDRRLLGIFTERDALLRLNVDAAKHANKPISSVMTANPATLRSRDKIAYALHRMNVGGFRHIPILDDEEKLHGVISIRGILAYLTDRNLAKS